MSNVFPTGFGVTNPSGNTAFHYYDDDASFQTDAQRFAVYATEKLGFPVLQVELYDPQIYTCYEDGINEYSSIVNTWNTKYWLTSILGKSTSSNLTHQYPLQNIDLAKRLVEPYVREAGLNSPDKLYSASFTLNAYQQKYDLRDYIPAAHTSGWIDIQDVLHYAPSAIGRALSAWYGGGGAEDWMAAMSAEFGADFSIMGSSAGIAYYIYPLTMTVQRAQQIELSDRIRRSEFTWRAHDNIVEIYPAPGPTQAGIDVYFTYYVNSSTATGRDSATPDASISGISDISNAPYQRPTYAQLTPIALQWIKNYSMANVKEMLGVIRNKFKTVPIPENEVQLNGDDLINQSKEEKDKLRDQLAKDMQELDPREALRKQADMYKAIMDQHASAPLGIYTG